MNFRIEGIFGSYLSHPLTNVTKVIRGRHTCERYELAFLLTVKRQNNNIDKY